MRRILMLNSTLHVGGAEQVAANIAECIDPERFELTVCYLKENGAVGEAMVREGVKLVALPGFVSGKLDYLSSLKLRKLIRQGGYELVHTHDLHGFMDACICRLITPGLKHVHTFHFGNYPNREPRYKRIESLLWRVPDALVAVGHEQKKAIQSTYGMPEHRLRVLWNGVEPHRLPIDERVAALLANETRVVIGSISTMIEQKGIPHLLDALAQLKQRRDDFVVLVIGDGPLRESFTRRCAELGLAENVHFMGWVPEAAARALPKFDIFVQSSLWEAMSMVVLEAMAAARPMVVTEVGENSHVVEPDKSGMLVPPADPAALAVALERLIDDEALRLRLGAAARARYESQFTVAHMVRRYEQLYDELLGADKKEVVA